MHVPRATPDKSVKFLSDPSRQVAAFQSLLIAPSETQQRVGVHIQELSAQVPQVLVSSHSTLSFGCGVQTFHTLAEAKTESCADLRLGPK